jgi:hypothetical protein
VFRFDNTDVCHSPSDVYGGYPDQLTVVESGRDSLRLEVRAPDTAPTVTDRVSSPPLVADTENAASTPGTGYAGQGRR